MVDYMIVKVTSKNQLRPSSSWKTSCDYCEYCKEVETGCTIHYVTETVDNGPILIQKKCSVGANDTPDSLKKKVQSLEGEAFIDAIKSFQNNIY